MPKQSYSATEAARALGISVDTLRRWDRDGKIEVGRDAANRRVVAAAEVERLHGPHGDETLSARNRFRGVVRSVELDGLLAKVEIDVTEPARVVAIVTRESVEELGLKAGMSAAGVVKSTSVMVERAMTPSLDRRRRSLRRQQADSRSRAPGRFPGRRPAATDDELAFANFGAASELLLKDYYAQVQAAKLYKGALAGAFARAGFAAGEHVVALSNLLVDSGQTAPLVEDFEFAWPTATFKTRKAAATAGLSIVDALLGAYLTAAATSPTQSVRVLFSSLAASLGEQRSTLLLARGRTAVGNSFPAAVDLETASAAVERYLG